MSFNVKDLFRELDGQSFQSKQDLDTAIKQHFDAHAAEFQGFQMVELIGIATSRGWLVKDTKGKGYHVFVK